MSTENWLITAIWIVSVVLAGASLGRADDSYGNDPVLKFYCTQSAAANERADPLQRDLSFALTATTHYKRIASDGHVIRVDTAVVQYFFSGGGLDSQTVRSQPSEKARPLPWSVPDFFSDHYLHTFYPNDTGGAELAIGFDTPTAEDTLPVGLAIIDRDNYLLRRLYLYYAHRPGYRRFSLGYRFREHDGYLFPDSVWEVGAKEGIFSTEDYRWEAKVDTVSVFGR